MAAVVDLDILYAYVNAMIDARISYSEYLNGLVTILSRPTPTKEKT